jgi:hypothetical protein
MERIVCEPEWLRCDRCMWYGRCIKPELEGPCNVWTCRYCWESLFTLASSVDGSKIKRENRDNALINHNLCSHPKFRKPL